MSTPLPSPQILPPLAGTTFALAGDLLTFKAIGDNTGGNYTLLEVRSEPGAGIPRRLHRHEEVSYFVLDGLYAFDMADRAVELGPGGFVLGPRGVPHSFRNVGPTPGRLLLLVTPGGLFERFTAEAGRAGVRSTGRNPSRCPPNCERLFMIAAKYGIEFLPP